MSTIKGCTALSEVLKAYAPRNSQHRKITRKEYAELKDAGWVENKGWWKHQTKNKTLKELVHSPFVEYIFCPWRLAIAIERFLKENTDETKRQCKSLSSKRERMGNGTKDRSE